MKKRILSTLAVGALLAGGAVQAQTVGDILGAIVGQVDRGTYYGAQSGPYQPPAEVLRDSNGNYFFYDDDGRPRYLIPGTNGTWAQPYAYGNGNYAYRNRSGGDRDGDGVRNRYDGDRDGDGVANRYDRRPNNRNRY